MWQWCAHKWLQSRKVVKATLNRSAATLSYVCCFSVTRGAGTSHAEATMKGNITTLMQHFALLGCIQCYYRKYISSLLPSSLRQWPRNPGCRRTPQHGQCRKRASRPPTALHPPVFHFSRRAQPQACRAAARLKKTRIIARSFILFAGRQSLESDAIGASHLSRHLEQQRTSRVKIFKWNQ